MAWNDDIKAAAKGWLGPETWYTGHPLDKRRFHVFVNKYWELERGLWDEADMRERLVAYSKELHPSFEEAERKRVVAKYVALGQDILDYHCSLVESGR